MSVDDLPLAIYHLPFFNGKSQMANGKSLLAFLQNHIRQRMSFRNKQLPLARLRPLRDAVIRAFRAFRFHNADITPEEPFLLDACNAGGDKNGVLGEKIVGDFLRQSPSIETLRRETEVLGKQSHRPIEETVASAVAIETEGAEMAEDDCSCEKPQRRLPVSRDFFERMTHPDDAKPDEDRVCGERKPDRLHPPERRKHPHCKDPQDHDFLFSPFFDDSIDRKAEENRKNVVRRIEGVEEIFPNVRKSVGCPLRKLSGIGGMERVPEHTEIPIQPEPKDRSSQSDSSVGMPRTEVFAAPEHKGQCKRPKKRNAVVACE